MQAYNSRQDNGVSRYSASFDTRRQRVDREGITRKPDLRPTQAQSSRQDNGVPRYSASFDTRRHRVDREGTMSDAEVRGVSRDSQKRSDPQLHDNVQSGTRHWKLKPLEMPYTTAASEFIYGTSSVIAALKAGRRKFYKLYLAEKSTESIRPYATLEKLAKLRDVPIVYAQPHQIGSLDQATKGRPHNVCPPPFHRTTRS